MSNYTENNFLSAVTDAVNGNCIAIRFALTCQNGQTVSLKEGASFTPEIKTILSNRHPLNRIYTKPYRKAKFKISWDCNPEWVVATYGVKRHEKFTINQFL